MKNLFKFILIFLILGLYVDIKMMPKDDGICVGKSKQRTLNVQVIVPFMPKRHTFYLGIGNRHYDHQRYTTYYIDSERKDNKGLPIVLKVRTSESGCLVYYKNLKENGGYSFFGKHATYINLRPFSRIQEDGIIDWDVEERYVSKEDYEKWWK